MGTKLVPIFMVNHVLVSIFMVQSCFKFFFFSSNNLLLFPIELKKPQEK